MPADRRNQLGHVDRLDDMLDHAGFETEPPNLGQRMRRQSDDRQLRMHVADAPGRFVAVEHRHLHVHQDGIEGRRAMLVETLHGLLAVFGEYHLGAFVTQQLLQQDAIDLVVLGREQANARSLPRSAAGRAGSCGGRDGGSGRRSVKQLPDPACPSPQSSRP